MRVCVCMYLFDSEKMGFLLWGENEVGCEHEYYLYFYVKRKYLHIYGREDVWYLFVGVKVLVYFKALVPERAL